MQRHGADSPRDLARLTCRARRGLAITLATSGLLVAAPSAMASVPSGGMAFATPAAAAPAAAAPAAPATASVPVTRTVPLTRSQTRSVQRKVRVRPDGVIGSGTRKAIRRFQARRSLMQTGRPNLQTLRAMKLGFAEKIAARLVSTAHSTSAVVTNGYAFPVLGPWRFGGSATVFGANRGHQGNDLFAACGTPIGAASAGTIKINKFEARAGNYVVVTDTPSGEDHVYMHLESRSTLAVGTRIEAGTQIGFMGDTGRADGCHLHFEIWTAPGWYSGGSARDPRSTLQAWAAGSGTKQTKNAGM